MRRYKKLKNWFDKENKTETGFEQHCNYRRPINTRVLNNTITLAEYESINEILNAATLDAVGQ